MNAKHDCKAEIRGHHKAAQLDDVLQVGTGNHFGHQRQHAVRRQLHDQTDQLHHPGLQGINRHQHALAFGFVIFQQLQRRHAEESGENHYADDRRWIGTGQIGKRVFRDKGEQQLRRTEIRDFTNVVALDGAQTRGFLRALYQPLGAEVEQAGHQHAHQCGNGGGKQQHADGQHADFAQRRGVMQPRHRTEDRGKYQWHDNHLQQLNIAVADDVEPANRLFHHRAVFAINGLQCQAKDRPQHQAGQHTLRQAPALVADAV